MTAKPNPLADRVRDRLLGQPTLTERSMFGGRVFMIDGSIVVSAQPGGDLLVRVGADQHDELLGRRGAAQAQMGQGRSMGRGWITVSSEVLAAESALDDWLELALTNHQAVNK